MAENDYNRMSSVDMAAALNKYGGRVSKGLLEAISARLIRNAELVRGVKDAHQPYHEEVTKVAQEYVNEPTNANFERLACMFTDCDDCVSTSCIRAKALHDAAVLLASMKGCPPGACPRPRTGDAARNSPFALCDGSPRADCWYGYLKEGLDND